MDPGVKLKSSNSSRSW